MKKAKSCWIARQNEDDGFWKLALCVGNEEYRLEIIVFDKEEDVKKALKANIVFVHSK